MEWKKVNTPLFAQKRSDSASIGRDARALEFHFEALNCIQSTKNGSRSASSEHSARKCSTFSAGCFPQAPVQVKMVLELDDFRDDKGGSVEKIRKNQADRYKDVSLVDKVTQLDYSGF